LPTGFSTRIHPGLRVFARIGKSGEFSRQPSQPVDPLNDPIWDSPTGCENDTVNAYEASTLFVFFSFRIPLSFVSQTVMACDFRFNERKSK
jgi:hypothetical protein